MAAKCPLGPPPSFVLGGWALSPVCPLGCGDTAQVWRWKGMHPQDVFGGGNTDSDPMAATRVDATSALSLGATKPLWWAALGAAPGLLYACVSPRCPRCPCPPRPRVLRSPPVLAAAVTCHRVLLSPPRLMEMAGDGAGAAARPRVTSLPVLSPPRDGSRV